MQIELIIDAFGPELASPLNSAGVAVAADAIAMLSSEQDAAIANELALQLRVGDSGEGSDDAGNDPERAGSRQRRKAREERKRRERSLSRKRKEEELMRRERKKPMYFFTRWQ